MDTETQNARTAVPRRKAPVIYTMKGYIGSIYMYKGRFVMLCECAELYFLDRAMLPIRIEPNAIALPTMAMPM